MGDMSEMYDFDIDEEDASDNAFMRFIDCVLSYLPSRKLRADEWCTADRVVMRISRMKTSHVLNALNYVRRKNGRMVVGERRMNNLEREGRKRGLVCDTQGWWHDVSVF